MKKHLIVFAIVLLTFTAVRPSFAGDPGATAYTADPAVQNELYGITGGEKIADLQSEPGQATCCQVYSPFIDFKAKYCDWLEMVHRTHEEEQPDWMTPVAVVPPTLQQEIRTDFSLSTYKGLETDTYLSKGTEIIPTENTEFIFGNPTWVTKQEANGRQISGWGDWFTLFKYRLFASPSTADNFAVTFLLQSSFATGSNGITAGHEVVTPMLGFGKGIKTSIGEFDYQATIGPAIPDADFSKFGTPVTWNSAFQYGNRFCIGGYMVPLWPEFEVEWVTYPNGADSGQNQVYLMPGINFGRFPLSECTYLVVGAGYQYAATGDRSFGHQWLITMRIPYF